MEGGKGDEKESQGVKKEVSRRSSKERVRQKGAHVVLGAGILGLGGLRASKKGLYSF